VTPPLASASARRLAQEGVSPDAADRAVAVIERSLAADGPLTRGQLRDRIAAAGVRTEGQALVHELMLATLRGITVRGPMVGGEQALVLARDWLGAAPAPVDRDVALAELARRYLAGHGPAAAADLAKWAGLPLRDARTGLSAIAGELAERDDGLADLAGRERAEPGRDGTGRRGSGRHGSGRHGSGRHGSGRQGGGLPPPRLLGAFDPLLHGWVSREAILGQHRGIVTINGLFRPFALVAGRAVATWGLPDGVVVLDRFGELSARVEAELAVDGADVRRFLGLA
jgi:hypothetical protein